MKIVISSTGSDLKSEVDPRFGRAAFLLLYDTDKMEVVEVVNNAEGQDAAQGAGINVAGLMAQKGVQVILTGRVGPKAMAVIDKAGIKVVSGAMGTVEDAINAFIANTNHAAPSLAEVGQAAGMAAGTRCRSGNRGEAAGRGVGLGKGRGGGGRGMGRSPGR